MPSHAILAADSVFAFIRRTVECDGGRCRWKTADYANQLHYGITIFNGVGGIPLFLADYARLRGNEEALELAWGALEWCADPGHEGPTRGLHFGKTGPAFAVLYMEAAAKSSTLAALCERVTASLLHEDPGPVTDILGGASSNGYYLLRAWKRHGDHALLAGAVRCGEWVQRQLIRDELGCHCLVRPDGNVFFGNRPYTGFAHGISGVAFFFALLYEATQESVWKKMAMEIFDTLIAHAQPTDGGWNWSILLGNEKLTRCQWSHGAPGIGLAFLRAAEIFDDPRLLHAARMAGEATYQYGDFRKNPTQCVGLAGGGDFLLELYRVTRENCWLDRAIGSAGKSAITSH
jgi:lantibiotic modifying enzyme